MVIKPIETEYKGYRFRSRLEARWSVFFETLELDWEYESEGFHLENGNLYLPDFWLTDINMWAEVKASFLSLDELLKCKFLVQGSGLPCLLLIGTPDNKHYDVIENNFDGKKLRNFVSSYHWSFDFDFLWDNVEAAVTAARSARFEWGETP